MWERLASVVHGVLLTGASAPFHHPFVGTCTVCGVLCFSSMWKGGELSGQWMGAEVFAQHGQGDGGELPAAGIRVTRAFLYCRSFSSVSATPRVVVLF